jgi:hypothetical protein
MPVQYEISLQIVKLVIVDQQLFRTSKRKQRFNNTSDITNALNTKQKLQRTVSVVPIHLRIICHLPKDIERHLMMASQSNSSKMANLGYSKTGLTGICKELEIAETN